jgi:hypothetical protein
MRRSPYTRTDRFTGTVEFRGKTFHVLECPDPHLRLHLHFRMEGSKLYFMVSGDTDIAGGGEPSGIPAARDELLPWLVLDFENYQTGHFVLFDSSDVAEDGYTGYILQHEIAAGDTTTVATAAGVFHGVYRFRYSRRVQLDHASVL